MNDNVLILLIILVAANVILVGIAVILALVRRRHARLDGPDTLADVQRPIMTSPADGRGYVPGALRLDGHPMPSRTDPLTGLLLPGEWNRIVADEDARIQRYGRPATIVVVELDGLDRLVSALGQEAGDRLLPAVSDALSRNARGADHLARLGPGRFGILLPETGEVAAINYIERVRDASELWLESGAIALRLAFGWASPSGDTHLGDALVQAMERMYAELRRNARNATDLDPDGPTSAADLEGSPSPA
jgi:diguanylate cyclase (GGDEF)-like protein